MSRPARIVITACAFVLVTWAGVLRAPAGVLLAGGVGTGRPLTPVAAAVHPAGGPPVAAAPPRAATSDARSRSPRPGRAATAAPADPWSALARCESGGNPQAVGGGGRYYGAFQFDLTTWAWLGLPGNPVEHPYEVQLQAARVLQSRQGWTPWPRCARALGLLPAGSQP